MKKEIKQTRSHRYYKSDLDKLHRIGKKLGLNETNTIRHLIEQEDKKILRAKKRGAAKDAGRC